MNLLEENPFDANKNKNSEEIAMLWLKLNEEEKSQQRSSLRERFKLVQAKCKKLPEVWDRVELALEADGDDCLNVNLWFSYGEHRIGFVLLRRWQRGHKAPPSHLN